MLQDFKKQEERARQPNTAPLRGTRTWQDQFKKDKRDYEWFYNGVRRFNMTAEDHLREHEERQKGRVSRFFPQQPIGPAKKDNEMGNLTVEQVKSMKESECAAPLLDGAFGTLLSYGDKGTMSSNQAAVSRFAPAPSWAIDPSPRGNDSYFGEDHGAPPKRVGRDPQYVSPPLDSTTWSEEYSYDEPNEWP